MKTIDKRRTDLEEIRKKNGIEYVLLAEWTGIDYDVLWRQFNTSKHFRDDVATAVEDAFRKHGLIINDDDHLDKLKDELLDTEAIINGAVSLMIRSFQQKAKDKKFKPNEKNEYKADLKRMQNKINDSIDTMILTVDMK